MTVTPESHRRVLQRTFNPADATLRDIFGWNRWFQIHRIDEEILQLLRRAGAVEQRGGLARSAIRFSTYGPYLVAHSGYPTTGHDAVFFGPDTYRFLKLIERFAQHCGVAPERIAEIGTGTGTAAIHLGRRFPDATVVATDINQGALQFCAVNAVLNDVAVAPCYSDIMNGVPGVFDLIVANPPYLLDAGRRQYRHGGGKSGEALSLRIVQEGSARLSPNGKLVLYTGVAMEAGADHFRNALEDMLSPTPWMIYEYDEIDPDVFGEELDAAAYARCDRIAVVGVVVASKH